MLDVERLRQAAMRQRELGLVGMVLTVDQVLELIERGDRVVGGGDPSAALRSARDDDVGGRSCAPGGRGEMPLDRAGRVADGVDPD